MARFNEMQLSSGGMFQLGTPSGYTKTLFNMNGTSVSFVANFTPPEDVTITHLGLSYFDRTGTPPIQRVSLQRPTSAGVPDGALLASRTFTPPPDSGWNDTFQWIALLNPYSADRGETLCLVLEYFSGPVSNSNRSRYFIGLGNSRDGRGHYPYYLTNNGAQVRNSNAPVFGYKSSIRSYGLPLVDVADEVINSPGEAGLRFILDNGFGSGFQLAGGVWIGKLAAVANQTVDLVLYNLENEELDRVTFDVEHAITPTGVDQTYQWRFDDATLATLDFGREYFLVLAPSAINTGTRLRTLDIYLDEDMTALRGGSSFYLVTRPTPTDPWTEHRDRRPMFTDLILAAWSV